MGSRHADNLALSVVYIEVFAWEGSAQGSTAAPRPCLQEALGLTCLDPPLVMSWAQAQSAEHMGFPQLPISLLPALLLGGMLLINWAQCIHTTCLKQHLILSSKVYSCVHHIKLHSSHSYLTTWRALTLSSCRRSFLRLRALWSISSCLFPEGGNVHYLFKGSQRQSIITPALWV